MSKISQLPVLANPTGAELVPIADGNVTKRIALQKLLTSSAALAGYQAMRAAFAQQVTIGTVAGAGANQASVAATYAFGPRFLQRAIWTGAEVWTKAAGTTAFRRAAPIADADIHNAVGPLLNFTFAAGGRQIITEADIVAANGGAPFIIEPGELFVGGSTGGLQFDGSAEPYWVFPNGLGEQAAAILKPSDAGATFKVLFTFRLAPMVQPRISRSIRRYDGFSRVPLSWLNLGNRAIPDGTGALTLTAAGFFDQLICPVTVGLDRFSVTYEVSTASTATELVFTTNPTVPADSGQFDGMMFTLRFADQQLWSYQVWDGNKSGSNAIPPIDAVDKFPIVGLDGAQFLVPNRRYAVRVTKMYRDHLIEIIAVDGPGYFSKRISDNGWNTYKKREPQNAPQGNTHAKYGLMHGAPSIVSLGAASKLHAFRIDVDYDATPFVLVLGDSIKEGYGVLLPFRVADMLEAEYGKRQAATAGVGGSTTIGMISRLATLLEVMRPQYVVLAFGTNGGDDAVFASNMALAIRMIRQIGAIPIIETVPIDANKSNIIKGLGVTVVDVAGALRQAGAGSTAVDPYYALIRPDDPPGSDPVYDRFHPNALANQRTRAQTRRDAGI